MYTCILLARNAPKTLISRCNHIFRRSFNGAGVVVLFHLADKFNFFLSMSFIFRYSIRPRDGVVNVPYT